MNRRSFLGRGLLGAGAAGLGAAGGLLARPGAAPAAEEGAGARAERDGLLDRIGFDGPHQRGILEPPQAHATFAALDVVAPNAGELATALQGLSLRARALCAGGAYAAASRDAPPADSGTLGPTAAPDGQTVTIALGASLFDDRFGLAARRPARLRAMPAFAGDELDPAQCHGDVLIQIGAHHRDTVVHTLRELLRQTHGALELRWTVDGFTSADRGPRPQSARRNLFAFRDGTASPDPRDAALMDRLTWSRAGEPAWAAGGTYQVVRLIRMHVEFWDRVGLREQEEMIGRTRDTGAPLGGTDELQDPRYDLDPQGRRIPLDAHMRLANPRTPETADQRFLRRPFNFHRGFDPAGTLDQGLVFVAYNQDPERQFATVQRRLAGEPMTDYVSVVGGGWFFVPPGTGGRTGWVGSGLFT